MTAQDLINRVVTDYYADEQPPQLVQQAYEKAVSYFGGEFVELHDGLKNYPIDVLRRVENFFARHSVYRNGSWERLENVVGESDQEEVVRRIVNDFEMEEIWTRWAIVLHFPRRTITNEKEQSIVITDLFVRIPFKKSGQPMPQNFSYMRSSYPFEQYSSGYRHSHTPSINQTSPTMDWSHVCTGTGPINQTIHNLTRSTNFNEDLWSIYFWELDKIIGIESETGGPYMHLHSIGQSDQKMSTRTDLHPGTFRPWFMSFLKSYLKTKRFKVVYQNRGYCLGTSFLEWLVDFSNYYIKWVNAMDAKGLLLIRNPLDCLTEYCIKDNQLVKITGPNAVALQRARDLNSQNIFVIKFKDEDFHFKVDIIADDTSVTKVTLLQYDLAASVLYVLLQTLNYRYGKELPTEEIPDTLRYKRRVQRIIKNDNTPDSKAFFLGQRF